MNYKLYSAFLLAFLSASDLLVSASTKPATTTSGFKRIQQQEQTNHVAFFHKQQQQQQQQSQKPSLTGWVKDFSGTVKEDFVEASAPRRCKKEEIIHECVINYSWGLVGNF
jgi:hypothetical protein